MSPTPTPAPPYPPLDLTPAESAPGARFAEAVEHLSGTSTADLDLLLDGVYGGNPFLAPFRVLPFRVEFGHDSVTLVTAPYLLPTLLVGAAVIALIVVIHSRATSPEAQARREGKRAAIHARYTDLIHGKRERAVEARIAERRVRDAERARAREARIAERLKSVDDVSSGTP